LQIPQSRTVFRKPRGLPPNAMLEQIEPTHQRLYFPMGESLLFQTNSQILLQAADDAFGRFPRRSGEGASPLVLRCFVHDGEPEHERQYAVERPRPIYRTQGHLFYISAGAGNTVVADLTQGYAFGFLTPQIASDLAFVRYVFLQGMGFAMLSTARQYIGVHAACVVKEEMSFILQGSSGAGKSTTAYACARRGYQVLTEDGLLIKIRPGGVRLWGAPWKLHLLPESKRFFPELERERPRLQMNGEWKLELELDTLIPGSTTTDAASGLVLFLERGGSAGATRIEPVPLAEALDEFHLVWPWSMGWTEEMEQQLADLLEGKTYRLYVNGSPDQVVDLLDELLAEIPHRVGSP
jgi:hypothetical protein